MAYLIVGVLSIGAGVAIAGFPNNVPVDATILPPATTEAPAPSVPETTVAPPTTVPETTAAPTTAPETTQPATTQPVTTEPGDSDPAALPDRSEFNVVAANGANVAGAALRVATRLEELGYVDVLPRDGTELFDFTTIYFADGLEDAALRLADDLDLLPEFVAPLVEAPSVPDLPLDTQLLTYIGRDRA